MKTYLGVDVSKHNAHQQTYKNIIDWQRVKAAGYCFAYIKCSEGETYVDPAFFSQLEAAAAAGFIVAPYHFFRHLKDATAQACNLYNTWMKGIEMLKAKGIKFISSEPMIDLEPIMQNKQGVLIDVDGINKLPKGEYARKAAALASQVKYYFGHYPLGYTYPGFNAQANIQLGKVLQPLGVPLWIAHYKVKKPLIQKPYEGAAIWQKSGTGKIDGAPSAIDLNELYSDQWAAAYPSRAELFPS